MIKVKRTVDWKERIEERSLSEDVKEYTLVFRKALPKMKDGDRLKLNCTIQNVEVGL